MPASVDRNELSRLVAEEGAQVVEVLPREEYDWAHLPGAIHLPLKELTAQTAATRLERERPVIAYCNDLQ